MSQNIPIRFSPFSVRVREVAWETHDTVTLFLQPDGEARPYRAGQFLTIDPEQFPALRQQVAYFAHIKGKRELPRAYSLASAPGEPYLAVTIKEEPFLPGRTEYPPLLSPYLVHSVVPGSSFEVKGFSGVYTLPEDVEDRCTTVVHIVAGSGVVPNFSILKDSLRRHPRLSHIFLDSNKTSGDIIFKNQLDALERSYPGRLRVFHCLTREKEAPPGQKVHLGRVSRDLLTFAIPDPQRCLFYACGPGLTRWEKKAARARGEEPQPRFLESVSRLLAEMGVPKERIKMEAYG